MLHKKERLQLYAAVSPYNTLKRSPLTPFSESVVIEKFLIFHTL